MKKKRKVIPFIISGILVLAIVLCVIVVVQIMSVGYVTVNGHSVFRVVTGSMEPTIPTGAVLISEETEIEDIKVNDIICFRSKTSEMLGQVITHRVVKIMESGDGGLCLETRGDANTVSDGYLVTKGNLIGKVTWYSGNENLLVRILSFLTGKIGFLACIVLPVFLIAGVMMKDTVKNIRKELNQMAYVSQQQPVKRKITLEDLLTPDEYAAFIEELKKEILEELTKGDTEKET